MVGKSGRLGVGLVGSGFMGKSHAFAFNAAGQAFDLPLKPELAVLADRTQEIAAEAARRLGFAEAVDDWRKLVAHPAVDVVAITAPNDLHKPVALAALAAGKHVYCEKPLAPTLAGAREMAEAAARSDRVTLAGFQYLKNPIIALARDIVSSGEIGEVVGFRGIHAEDYMTDPEAPYSFRNEPEGGGVLMDLGVHIVSKARHLVGPIAEVSAATSVVHKSRPAPGRRKAVAADDHSVFTARFENGAIGSFTASWVAPGRKMQLDFELIGTKGSLAFSGERFNELQLYTLGQSKARSGFKTILAGPDTPPFAAFCPAPGHQLGFNDMKTIEVAHLVRAVAGEEKASPDFGEAYEIQRVIAAATRSGQEKRWVAISDCV